MARVVALIPDLLFGSRVQADLLAAGHEVELVNSRETLDGGCDLNDRVADTDVLVIDLTDERLQGAGLVEALNNGDADTSSRPRTLGFYSHVDTATRARAKQAGFDLVVPRSRMARECAALVTRLAEDV